MKNVLIVAIVITLGVFFVRFYPFAQDVTVETEGGNSATVSQKATSSVTASGESSKNQQEGDSLLNKTLGSSGPVKAHMEPTSVESQQQTQLINALGALADPSKSGSRQPQPLGEASVAARQELAQMGAQALPAVLARLERFPALEEGVQARALTIETKRELLSLALQKASLIGVLGEIGNENHGPLLWSLATTTKGSGISSHASVLAAFRKMKADQEAQEYVQWMFADLKQYVEGQGPILDRLSLSPSSHSDVQLALRVSETASSNRLKGKALWLGAQIGLEKERLAKAGIVALDAGVRDSNELSSILFALAELLDPEAFATVVSRYKNSDKQAVEQVVYSAGLHNQFYWATDATRMSILSMVLKDRDSKNKTLAIWYMLENKRIDLLRENDLLLETNSAIGGSSLHYELKPAVAHFATLAGYDLKVENQRILMEKIIGYGWFRQAPR